MTIPKWLLPLIAIVAGLAVGVAATLIGMRFATPAATVPLTTETVPILAPTGLSASDTGTDPYAVSGAVGSAQIVSPGQRGATLVDADSQRTIDRYNASGIVGPGPDFIQPPAAPGSASDTGSGGGALAADDPCASTTPPSGCPTGVRSVVLADLRVAPDLVAQVYANPPTSSIGSPVSCPAGDLARGEVWVDVISNTPGVAHIGWAPIGDGIASAPVDVPTDPTEAQAFADYHTRTGGYRDQPWLFQHCQKLTGLDTTQRYVVTATFTDTLSRRVGPLLANLDPRGRPTTPTMQAVPLGSGLLYVSVPSPSETTGVRPVIHAWTIAAGDSPDCSAFGQHPDLNAVEAPVVIDVPAAELSRQNNDASYRSRDIRIYSVPEGTTVVICARWFNASAPSWNDSVPTLQKSITVSSPDAITPVLTLHSLELGKHVDAGAVNVSVSTPTGIACSGWSGPAAAGGPGSVNVGAGICDVAASGAGFEGRLAVTTTVRVGTASVVKTSLLQLQRSSCTGVCVLPPTSRYRIDLPTVTEATGLCGNGFPWESPCTPPTQQVSLGSAVIDVAWTQGVTPGNPRWILGAPDNDPPPAAPPVGPQLDTHGVPVVILAADHLSASAIYHVGTSEPAHFTATLSGSCFPAGTGDTLSGTTDGLPNGHNEVSLNWTHLCPAQVYYVTIALTDDAGITTTWGLTSAGGNRWEGGIIVTPSPEVHLVGTLYIGPMNAVHTAYGVARVTVETGAANGYPTPARLCTASSDGTGTAISFDIVAPERATVHLTVTVDVIEADPSNPPTGGPASTCGFTVVNHGFVVWSGDVDLHALLTYGSSFGGTGRFRTDTWSRFDSEEGWNIGGNATATELPVH